jgi:mannose-1-phosphate guanylyltransferase
VFREAVLEHLPRLARAFSPLAGGRLTPARVREAYARAPAISVDYGILEPARNVAVIPSRFAWDDLGSWPALARLGRGGGFRRGSVLAVDSPRLVAWAEAGTIVVIGVPDVVVVHTADATLVVPKDRAQEVRDAVARLERVPEGRQLMEG